MAGLPCALIGTGGHAKVVADMLRCAGREILFATTDGPVTDGETFAGVPVAGNDAYLDGCDPKTIELALGVGAPRPDGVRQRVWTRFAGQGFRAATLVHPAATVAADAVLEEGAQVMAGAIVQPGCRIGQGAIVNTGARIDHDCNIGAFAHIAPGATLCGDVTVGENSLVGAGATLTPGTRVGSGCLVAAGVTLSGSVGPGRSVHLEQQPTEAND